MAQSQRPQRPATNLEENTDELEDGSEEAEGAGRLEDPHPRLDKYPSLGSKRSLINWGKDSNLVGPPLSLGPVIGKDHRPPFLPSIAVRPRSRLELAGRGGQPNAEEASARRRCTRRADPGR